MSFPINKNASLKQSNFEKISSSDEILESSKSLRAGNKIDVKPSLIKQASQKFSSYQAKKVDAKANKLAFAELPSPSAVTSKAIKTQPSVDSILADSLAVRDGAYKGPSFASKIGAAFGAAYNAVKNFFANILSAVVGLFKKNENKVAFAALVGEDFVTETAQAMAAAKTQTMNKALAEAEKFATNALLETSLKPGLVDQLENKAAFKTLVGQAAVKQSA